MCKKIKESFEVLVVFFSSSRKVFILFLVSNEAVLCPVYLIPRV